ncbi:MAG: hypothetical protein NTU69_11280 [Proteobacteria bacterium]|nr:hypothetical protein [Pseudomonadota bacterium]
MYELTEEWLENINKEFSKNDIPHRKRPWLAWGEWSKYTGMPISMNDEVVKKIFYWFEKNTKAGSQQIGSMYTGVFYYDSCFWPILVPIIYGTVRVDARDSLKTMPETIVTRLWGDQGKLFEYISVWADCFDYAFGIDDIKKRRTPGGFAQTLLNSGDQQLKATIALLLENTPNAKAMESARMSTEMFLKAFLAAKAGLTEMEAKDRIRHDLEKALKECLDVEAKSKLKKIQSNLNVFPGIEDRYKGTYKAPKELWRGYAIAQFIASTVVRSFSGRNIIETLRIDGLSPKDTVKHNK